jgi:hypothetical protein
MKSNVILNETECSEDSRCMGSKIKGILTPG